MSEKVEVQMFKSYGVEAEIREGERGRFAVWDLGKLVFPSGEFVRITSITNEAKEEADNFGSLAAAVYRLQNGRPLRGTVNAIARRAVKNYTPDGVEFTVNALLKSLTGDREIIRSTKVASNTRRNRTGAAYDLAGQIFDAVATGAYVYLNEQGWKPAAQIAEDTEAETSGEAPLV